MTLTLLYSFALSLVLIYLIRVISIKTNFLVKPREDRWHSQATPTLGGVGVYLSTIIPILIIMLLHPSLETGRWGILLGVSVIFIVGVIDDFIHISPTSKLLGQILAASIIISFGYTTFFFTPRLGNSILAQFPNILLTFIWLVGITNAINLLDNMDGLAGGISLITASYLSYLFWKSGEVNLLPISLALTGALIGFLIWNFPPAKIFMGDSGSMFIGFTLAVLAIAREPQASNVIAVMGVPTLLFLLPIIDTIFVTLTRLMRGQSPAIGGRDHTSHRLIAFGLSERQAVLVMYVISAVSGIVAIVLEALDYDLSLVLIPLWIILLAIFAAYLSGIKVVSAVKSKRFPAIARFIVELTYRQRVFEIILDFFMIASALYLAFWTRYNFRLGNERLIQYFRAIPYAMISAYASFFLFGIYKNIWKFVSFDSLLGFFKAVGLTIVLFGGGSFFILAGDRVSSVVIVLFGVFLFLGLATTRSSFKFFDLFSGHSKNESDQRVLIVGIEESGEIAMRWIGIQPQLGYQTVGFIGSDPYQVGKNIHGLEIFGAIEQLPAVILEKNIDGVIIPEPEKLPPDSIQQIVESCHENGCWVKGLKLDFEIIE